MPAGIFRGGGVICADSRSQKEFCTAYKWAWWRLGLWEQSLGTHKTARCWRCTCVCLPKCCSSIQIKIPTGSSLYPSVKCHWGCVMQVILDNYQGWMQKTHRRFAKVIQYINELSLNFIQGGFTRWSIYALGQKYLASQLHMCFRNLPDANIGRSLEQFAAQSYHALLDTLDRFPQLHLANNCNLGLIFVVSFPS